MEVRLLLTFALVGLVLFGWNYLFPAPKAPPPPAKQASAPAPAQAKPEPPTPAKEPAKAAPKRALAKGKTEPVATPALASSEKAETYIIETPVYKIAFSNRGATVRSWVLKNYKDSTGKPVDLVNAHAGADRPFGWAFSYVFPREQPATDLNGVLFAAAQPSPLELVFTYNDGKVEARKAFKVDASLYSASYESKVAAGGTGLVHQLAWRGGFGDPTIHAAADNEKSVYFSTTENKLVEETAKVAENGPHKVTGLFQFAGLMDTYFAGVILPEGKAIDFVTWNDPVVLEKGSEAVRYPGMSFGGDAEHGAQLFLGPKDTDILKATNPKLTQIIDWGWFWFIAQPLFNALHWTYDHAAANWGWAIVLITIVINILMLPLRYSSLKSTQKMATIQPKIAAIQAKYKNLPMRDPRKQKQNEELMGLYQAEGINPMGGCIPLILQMPFFFAFFKVLSVSIELRGASWLWVADLSQPETAMIRWLPVGMLVTQVWMQKMTPATSPDPSQQRMMMILMPVMLTVMFWGASSGLVLYWLTGNVVGIVQQYFFNKLAQKPAAAGKGAVAPGKK
jgi:YidC/Oxa1 family membrane protein insertase